MSKPILYIDMDDVIVDFGSSTRIPLNEKHIYGHPAIYEEGFFRDLLPFENSIQAVQALIDSDKYDVWILTQPVSDSPKSYSEKCEWIIKYIPALTFKIKMTQDKTLCDGDYLIDDNIKWLGFNGKFIHFDPKNADHCWAEILDKLLLIK